MFRDIAHLEPVTSRDGSAYAASSGRWLLRNVKDGCHGWYSRLERQELSANWEEVAFADYQTLSANYQKENRIQ
jgi:hypothetical protein